VKFHFRYAVYRLTAMPNKQSKHWQLIALETGRRKVARASSRYVLHADSSSEFERWGIVALTKTPEHRLLEWLMWDGIVGAMP